MGSKNLKAVVARGTGGVKLADMTAFNKNIGKALNYWHNPTESCVKGLADHGTIMCVSFTNISYELDGFPAFIACEIRKAGSILTPAFR